MTDFVVAQLRVGIMSLIAENPAVVTPSRAASVVNGLGGTVYTGERYDLPKVRVRISHESAGVPANVEKPAGMDTSLSLYLLGDYRAALQEGDTIEYLGSSWRLGPANEMEFHGRTYAKEWPLIKGSA